jgi:two-component system heavy metal sensor histidine kinase CusS
MSDQTGADAMTPWERQALADQSARAFVLATRVRAGIALGFLPVVLYAALRGDPGWLPYLIPLVPYALVAICMVALSGAPAVRRVGAFSFVLDAVVVFELQRQAMPGSPFPAGVAGFSLGLFVLLVLLAGTSMHRGATLATALVSTPLELILMQQAGVGVGAQVAAVIVLAAAPAAQTRFVGWLVQMVRSAASLEVAHRVEVERVQRLEEARATIARLLDEATAQNKRLQALQADKEVLTSLIVHDLRAPLSAVRSNLDWLKAEVAALNNRDASEAVVESRQVVDRLTGMINDLLNVTGLESNALALSREAIVARAFLDALARQLSTQAASKQLVVDVVADELSFSADKALLQRALENLTSNALRYTPRGGRVRLEARRDGDDVLLAVRNDGPTIPAHARPTLFDKYTQGGDVKENRRAGWGLGLYFCRLCAESHGGRVSVEDSPDFATSFVVRLPRAARPQ